MQGQRAVEASLSLFVCAWCEAERERGRTRQQEPLVNWGICRDCLRRELAALARGAAPRVPAQAGAVPSSPVGTRSNRLVGATLKFPRANSRTTRTTSRGSSSQR